MSKMPLLGSKGGASISGFGRNSGANLKLYPFTTFTFTSGGTSGRNGPSLATLINSYNGSTYPWLNYEVSPII
jgi:hypothetical protein